MKILRITLELIEDEEFVGKKFGDLTVVEKTDERQGGHIMWLCQCVCGKFVKVRTTRLTNDLKLTCNKCFNGV